MYVLYSRLDGYVESKHPEWIANVYKLYPNVRKSSMFEKASMAGAGHCSYPVMIYLISYTKYELYGPPNKIIFESKRWNCF